jgi:hypothetical protein
MEDTVEIVREWMRENFPAFSEEEERPLFLADYIHKNCLVAANRSLPRELNDFVKGGGMLPLYEEGGAVIAFHARAGLLRGTTAIEFWWTYN